MKELTKEKAVELHRAMWDYITNALNILIREEMHFNGSFSELKCRAIQNLFCDGDLFKDATPEEYGFYTHFITDFIFLDQNKLTSASVYNNCFLCEYKRRLYNGRDYIQILNCEDVCPLFNPDNKRGGCLNGLYEECVNAFCIKDYRNCLGIATRIRDLPVVN